MIFSQTDIEAHIAPDQLNHGWKLFSEGCVTAPNIQRGGALVTAVIPQAGGRTLRVYIRTGNDEGVITINGECNCQRKKNCAHVAAVLLQALDDKQALLPVSTNKPPLTARSGTPGKSLNDVSGARLFNQQVLLYVLCLEEDALLIKTQVARRLSHGGYSFIRQYLPNRAAGLTPPRFLHPADIELLQVLEELPRDPDTKLPILEGPHSAHAMKSLLTTERCYLETGYLDNTDQATPLRLGPERPIDFQWQMDEFGYQQLVSHTTPEADTLLPLSSPWYLDSEKGECGSVTTNLPMALVTDLMLFPPVAPEQVLQAHNALSDTWPGTPIPPLQQLNINIAPLVKPVPCLRLTTLKDHPLSLNDYHDVACLSFEYDGIIINRYTPPTRVVEGQLVSVQRDKKVEQAAVKQLRKLGFEQDEDWCEYTGEDGFLLKPQWMDNKAQPWLDFQLDHLPSLLATGWHIEYDHFRFRLAEATNWVCDVQQLEQQDWFNIGLGVEVDGQRIDLLPVLLDFLAYFPRGLPNKEDITDEHFVTPFKNEQGEEHLLHLPTERVLPLLQMLLEIYDGANRSNQPDQEKQSLRLSRVQLARLTALDQLDNDSHLHWLADDDIRQLARRLRDVDGISTVNPPLGLMAELRPYQQQGLNWLQFLREYQLAGILADDMGLGKTLQALSHLLLEKEAGRADRPSLVIAPTSLMFNWRYEAQRFAPQLKVLVLHGPKRNEHFHRISKHDLVITTYPLLARDKDTLIKQQYHMLILDEAQVIKNPKAQASRIVRDIDTRHRLCLTGTPLENHLGELWSLIDFLLPGLLGDGKHFRRFFRTPIEKHANKEVANFLSRRIRPFLLRRTKQQVATELPDKTEIVQSVALDERQRELYETVRQVMHRRVLDEIERQGLARSHIVVLDALLKLRQVCCDPRLVKIDQAQSVKQSAKLDMLMSVLPEMIEEGRRILVFSQFTTMLSLIEDEVKTVGIDYVKLTGQTRDREAQVHRFQEGKVPLFLISLKAGGVGLNLTTADTVIHYDPWWNPAVERQATDRAHRIGQQQAVFVYKLICEGTVEEKIHVMQQHKQALADGLYQHGGSTEPQWNEQDLENLFGPLDV